MRSDNDFVKVIRTKEYARVTSINRQHETKGTTQDETKRNEAKNSMSEKSSGNLSFIIDAIHTEAGRAI